MKKLFLLAVLSAVVCGAAAHPNHIFGVRVGMNIACPQRTLGEGLERLRKVLAR